MKDSNDLSTDQIMIVLPSNMIAQIDAQVGGNFVNRQEFIRAASRHYLEYLQSNSTKSGLGRG